MAKTRQDKTINKTDDTTIALSCIGFGVTCVGAIDVTKSEEEQTILDWTEIDSTKGEFVLVPVLALVLVLNFPSSVALALVLAPLCLVSSCRWSLVLSVLNLLPAWTFWSWPLW